MAIVLVVVGAMMAQQNKEASFVRQKVAAMDIEKLLTANLNNGSICTYQVGLSAATYNLSSVSAATPVKIPLTGIPSNGVAGAPNFVAVGTSASASASELVPTTIEIQIVGGAPDTWSANYVINFDSTKLVRQIPPVSVTVTLDTDPATPLTAKKIIGCGAAACTAGTYNSGGACTQCPVGQYQDLIGQTSCKPCAMDQTTTTTGATICISCFAALGVHGYRAAVGPPNCTACTNPMANGTGTYGADGLGTNNCAYATVNCNAGSGPAAGPVCQQCTFGQYSPGGATSCAPCAAGKYTSSPGQSVCGDCTNTSAGQFWDGPGTSVSNCHNSPCTNAAIGKYWNGHGGTDPNGCSKLDCTNKPIGQYWTGAGGASATGCTNASCTNNPPGQYWNGHGGSDPVGCAVTPCTNMPQGGVGNLGAPTSVTYAGFGGVSPGACSFASVNCSASASYSIGGGGYIFNGNLTPGGAACTCSPGTCSENNATECGGGHAAVECYPLYPATVGLNWQFSCGSVCL